MKNSVSEFLIGPRLLEMVTRFYEGIYTRSAEEQVPTILSEAARVFEADIATWFLVTEDRTELRVVDLYNDLGKTEQRPPLAPYLLNWEAKCENDVQGLTAWAAISGDPLYIPSIDSLLIDHGYCHAGKWDNWVYPHGIKDTISGFLCMCAVPLISPLGGPPKESVYGVLRMERRRTKGGKKRDTFTQTDLMAFNIIARIMGFAYFHSERQKSLTLADIGHALIRPLGDVALTLEGIQEDIAEDEFDKNHIEYQLSSAVKMLRAVSSMSSLAKENFHQPLQINEVDFYHDLYRQCESIVLTSGRRIKLIPDKPIRTINLTKRKQAALMNITINLLQNATQNSPIKSEIEVSILLQEQNLILIIINPGVQIGNTIIEKAEKSKESYLSFRGLPRSYQLAAQNGWDLEYSRTDNKNCFKLTVPLN